MLEICRKRTQFENFDKNVKICQEMLNYEEASGMSNMYMSYVRQICQNNLKR